MLEKCGIRSFSVYSAQEALEVFKSCNEKSSIMIMGDMNNNAIEWAVKNEVEFYVFTLRRLNQAVDYAKKNNKKALIHIEIETGMNRTGVDESDFKMVIDTIKKIRNI